MASNTETLSASRHLAGKYLTFSIHGESYGIDVLKIREIIRLIDITAVPQMPSYVRGVINLRGKIIPVVDLRTRFGFSEAGSTEQTCIVVVLMRLAENRSTQMGLVVDAVEEVVNINSGEIEETPHFGAQISTDCILGMAKVKGSVKTVLDIDKVLGGETTTEINSLTD